MMNRQDKDNDDSDETIHQTDKSERSDDEQIRDIQGNEEDGRAPSNNESDAFSNIQSPSETAPADAASMGIVDQNDSIPTTGVALQSPQQQNHVEVLNDQVPGATARHSRHASVPGAFRVQSSFVEHDHGGNNDDDNDNDDWPGETPAEDSIATAENEETIVVTSATVFHDEEILIGEVRDEKCSAYIFGRSFNLWFVAFGFIAVMGGCLAAVLVSIQDNKNNTPTINIPIDEGPSDSETQATKLRCTEMRSVVSTLSSTESLDDESSPQSRALDWLCAEDELQVALNDTKWITQRYTLAVMYYSMGGDYWKFDCDFLSAVHECDWVDEWREDAKLGVIDCNDEKQVTTIYNYWNNLNGTIPDEIEHLASLEHLDFVGGSLQGTIPKGIGSLINLTNLHLAENSLSGTVPSEFTNLTSLKYLTLNMKSSGLTGNLDFLCNMEIDVFQTDCNGPAPEVICPCCNICCVKGNFTCCVVQPVPWADVGYCYATLPEVDAENDPY